MANENFYSSGQNRGAPTTEAIAARAYELWQQQGCPQGRNEENWIEAERELLELNRSNSRLSSVSEFSVNPIATAVPSREEVRTAARGKFLPLSGEEVVGKPRERSSRRQELHAEKDMHIGSLETPYAAFSKEAPLATKVAQALRDRDEGPTAPGLTSLDPRV